MKNQSTTIQSLPGLIQSEMALLLNDIVPSKPTFLANFKLVPKPIVV